MVMMVRMNSLKSVIALFTCLFFIFKSMVETEQEPVMEVMLMIHRTSPQPLPFVKTTWMLKMMYAVVTATNHWMMPQTLQLLRMTMMMGLMKVVFAMMTMMRTVEATASEMMLMMRMMVMVLVTMKMSMKMVMMDTAAAAVIHMMMISTATTTTPIRRLHRDEQQ